MMIWNMMTLNIVVDLPVVCVVLVEVLVEEEDLSTEGGDIEIILVSLSI